MAGSPGRTCIIKNIIVTAAQATVTIIRMLLRASATIVSATYPYVRSGAFHYLPPPKKPQTLLFYFFSKRVVSTMGGSAIKVFSNLYPRSKKGAWAFCMAV